MLEYLRGQSMYMHMSVVQRAYTIAESRGPCSQSMHCSQIVGFDIAAASNRDASTKSADASIVITKLLIYLWEQ